MNVRTICISAVLGLVGFAHATEASSRWTPPKTSIPKSFVDAVGFAFEHGLADPKGGEFHEVTITCNKQWQDGDPKYKVTGWLMPAKGDQKAYVICWNGLPYHEFEIGPTRDLASFIKEKLANPGKLGWFNRRNPENIDASDPLTPLGMAFMLSLGRSDLAERLVPRDDNFLKRYDKQLFEDIVWFRYNRAVLAFLRENNELTKEDGEWLVKNFDAIKDKNQPEPFNDERFERFQTLLNNANQRIKQGSRVPFDPDKNKTLPVDKRVAEIIDHLDEAQVHMWMTDDPDWRSDPIYWAAIVTGEPMLDALVDCMEKDKRYTRNDGNGRSLGRYHNLIPVSRLALTLLQEISGVKVLPKLRDGKIDFKTLRAQVKH